MNVTIRYTLYGAVFGLCFPVVATMIRVNQTGLSAWDAQHRDALLWIIDSAPFFLGLFSSFAGKRQQDLELINSEQAQTIFTQQARAIESARLASLGEMASGVAHEINNPLTIISAASDYLLASLKTSEPDREKCVANLDKISRSATRISRIVKSLRLIAREGTNDPFIETSVKDLISETLDFCQARLSNHQVDLRVLVQEEDLKIEARPVQISQALINLINNAFDAVSGSAGAWIQIEAKDKGDVVVFSVTDSGKGIPPKIADKIMRPFFTTKELGKGTGLGLSITNGIMKDHGSELILDTKHPNTRFVFSLPKKHK